MIIGKRVRLRALSKKDLPFYIEWLNDPEVLVGLSIYLPLSMEMEEKWFARILELPAEEHPMTIEAQENENWFPIGNCGFFGIDWRVRSAEFGIFIGNKQYWGRGYGQDAIRLLLTHGFGTLNLNRIFLKVYEHNKRAIRAYEKIGFVREGRLREAHFYQGKYRDVFIMGMLRGEWGNMP